MSFAVGRGGDATVQTSKRDVEKRPTPGAAVIGAGRGGFRSARARDGRAPGFEVARGGGRTHVFLSLGRLRRVHHLERLRHGDRGVHARRAGRDPLQELARVEELVLEALHALAQRHVGLGFGVIPRRSPLTVHVDQRSVRARLRGTTRRREDAWGGRDPSRL